MCRLVQRLLLRFILVPVFVHAQQTTTVPRPPQYVLLAFDGSLNLGMWDETLFFAKNNSLKFTYFISGVYFLMNDYKKTYVEPTHGAGVSAIGWGGSSAEKIKERIDFVNLAHDSGHEIGSHANGHFSGSGWSLTSWQSEFRQFYDLIFRVLNINKIDTDTRNPFHFDPTDIIGFRAPYLGINSNLYTTLRNYNYAYDTSRTAAMNYWPRKLNSIWNFPLAQVRIAGTGKHTLSMDYNFYFAQSKGKEDPAHYQKYKDQMLNTYMGYFNSNYYGNRAPVHIGHHFSKWNGGAYWDAMKDFARKVCVMPEVQCISYRSLQTLLDETPSDVLQAYRDERFEKKVPGVVFDLRQSINDVTPKDIKLVMTYREDAGFRAVITGTDRAEVLQPPYEFVWTLGDKLIQKSSSSWLSLEEATADPLDKDVLSVSVIRNGNEMLRSSHELSYDEGADEWIFSSEDLEDKALAGDLPEAHIGEPN